MKHTIKSLSDYIILILYAICMYLLWKLCELGGVRYWMKIMLPFAVLLIILLIIRLVLRYRGYRASYFKIRLASFAAISLIFGGMIIHAAIPYNGALSWKVDDFLNHKKIEFKHDNIYENGINGVLNDIDRKLTLPDKLYVSDDFYVSFKENGTITNVEALIYGKDDKGKLKGYLLSYNYKEGDKINVWLNEGEGLSVNSDKLLEPFIRILKKSHYHYKEQVNDWSLNCHDQTYTFLYSGKTKVNKGEGLYILDLDKKRGSDFKNFSFSDGALIGYEASLYVSNNKDISPIKYLIDSEQISREALEDENDSGVVEQAQKSKGWVVDDTNGSVYNFVLDDKEIGYRLVVVNAAAGSRFYSLEKSNDGGQNWKVVNENPFADQAGVAEGILFFSNNLGFIGIQGASGEHSQIYITKDAGVSFRQVEVPMGQVATIPKAAKEKGLTLDDYQYISMPKAKNNKLFITVTAGEGESDGIDFYSDDYGDSWNVLEK